MCDNRANLGLLITLIYLLCMAQVALAAPQVSGARIGVYLVKRVVLDVSSTVSFRVFTLPEPYRVVLELPEVTWARDLRSPSNGGLVTGMRFGLFKPGLSRVVLDFCRFLCELLRPLQSIRRREADPIE